MTGKNRIIIYGPKDDGTYVVEFTTSWGAVQSRAVQRRRAWRACHRGPRARRARTFPGAFKPQCNVHGRINTFAVSAILNVQLAPCFIQG
jgi:hypothetical protein